MKTDNMVEFPIFEALIDDEFDGIVNISLVDHPAVMSNFVSFNVHSVRFDYSIQDDEKRIVFGVLMRADYNIYRYDKDLGQFYIRYSKETIKKMAEKLMLDNNHNNINLMHVDGSNVEGVNMLSLFIKDVERGIDPKGFEEIEDGSLFAEFHVNNDTIWSAIKDGTFKGFSIEGFFNINKISKEEDMSLKTEVMNAVIKFGEVNTDKGLIYWTGEEDLKEGDEVFVGEEKTVAPDGEYTTEDGKTIRVVEGKVAEIVDTKAEVDSEEEFKEEEVKHEEETTTEETVEEKVEETVTEPEPSEVDELRGEIENLKSDIETIKNAINQINEVLSKPAAEPIEQQFEKTVKKDVKRGNAQRILSHLND